MPKEITQIAVTELKTLYDEFEKIILVNKEKSAEECFELVKKWLDEKKFKAAKKDIAFKLFLAYDDLTSLFEKVRTIRHYDDNSVVVVSKDGKKEEKIYLKN